MSDKAVWMWNYGDYELFHNIKLHSRRQEFGMDFPPFFPIAGITPLAIFSAKVNVPEDDFITVKLNGKGRIGVDYKFYPPGDKIPVPKGERHIEITVINEKGLPAAYVCGKYVKSGKAFGCSQFRGDYKPVGCMPEYRSPSANVEKFPFKYRKVYPVREEETDGGTLYDFNEESFGLIVLEGLESSAAVYYGESREEALSRGDAILSESVKAAKKTTLRARAFRYIYVKGAKPVSLYAKLEYLPDKSIGEFRSDEALVGKVFEVCKHTFNLCSREFYLDGIKRDRWVWAGDAYQTYIINRYLNRDDETVKRTIIALLGKPPYTAHINTINDYSAYLIMMTADYYENTADADFIKAIYPRVKALYLFIKERLDENGFVVERPGDWIFIDWADFDKEGPHSFEQILLYKVCVSMRNLAMAVGDDEGFIQNEALLKEKIYQKFYDKELGGFIDGYVSGKKQISRQQNVMAVLTGFTTEKENALILEKVLKNPAVPPIKTPYFKFYELCAFCELGEVKVAQDMITEYWGGMLNDGATSFYEEYDPAVTGIEKYAMYGNKFAKSLCHAWGSGPIAMLLKYVAGVRVKDGGKSFTVTPRPGKYKKFTATVPVFGGAVKVIYDNGKIKVAASVSGGKLIVGGKTYIINEKSPVTAQLTEE